MRIEQLIAFDKVVQHSSFTKAANELYTTQPSVSKMIDALEDELGHQLLRRTSRGIELTAYGKWVYGDVKIILQMVNGWQESTPLEEVPREVHIQSTTTMCNFLSAVYPLPEGPAPRHQSAAPRMSAQRDHSQNGGERGSHRPAPDPQGKSGGLDRHPGADPQKRLGLLRGD